MCNRTRANAPCVRACAHLEHVRSAERALVTRRDGERRERCSQRSAQQEAAYTRRE
jgi:hypothetical protein